MVPVEESVGIVQQGIERIIQIDSLRYEVATQSIGSLPIGF
jgi:hypothetical protein